MAPKAWIAWLKRQQACDDAIEWCKQFDTLAEAWQKCERGDWMLWLLARKKGGCDRKTIVRAACKCARLALRYVPRSDKYPRVAIETAEAWCDGDKGVTLTDVVVAAHDAHDAHAAYAAYAAYTVTLPTDASHAIANAAAHAATYPARMRTLRRCADIVRGFVPNLA